MVYFNPFNIKFFYTLTTINTRISIKTNLLFLTF